MLVNKNAKMQIYGFSDIDECRGNHSCYKNAECKNTLGSHVCECLAGYTGNGQNCTGEFNLFASTFRHVRLQQYHSLITRFNSSSRFSC